LSQSLVLSAIIMILRKVEGEPHAQVHVIEWSRTQVVSTT